MLQEELEELDELWQPHDEELEEHLLQELEELELHPQLEELDEEQLVQPHELEELEELWQPQDELDDSEEHLPHESELELSQPQVEEEEELGRVHEPQPLLHLRHFWGEKLLVLDRSGQQSPSRADS